MIRKYKKKLIISSLLMLLPVLVGLLLWNQLPDRMATHWGVDGNVDGWASKTVAVFGMPLILIPLQLLGVWVTEKDPKQKNQSEKAISLIFWMMPVVSWISAGIMYGAALGAEWNIASFVFGMLGIMFIGIGNYMPKVKRNMTLGIKVKWAVFNEENWNATHRFGGKVWVAGGFLLLLLAFLPEKYFLIAILPAILLLAFAPMVYSYLYYKQQCARDPNFKLETEPLNPTMKKVRDVSLVIVTLILIFCVVIMFTGKIEYHFDQESFTIDPSVWNDLIVDYDAIESIELRMEAVPGSREYGFGSAKLLLGFFRNEEFGAYTRYTYTKCECAVVLRVDGKTLVIAGENQADTEAIYQALTEKMGG